MALIPIFEAFQSTLQSSLSCKILNIHFICPEVALILKLYDLLIFFFQHNGQTGPLGYKLAFSWLMYFTSALIIQATIMSSQGSGTT